MKIINVLLILILLLAGFYGYFFLNNYILKEKEFNFLEINKKIEVNASSELVQFSKNMRFAKNNLSYHFLGVCEDNKKERMKKAFDILKKEVEVIDFFEIDKKEADILIFCSEEVKKLEEEENSIKFIAGEGGPRKFINLTPYSLILQGDIYLYSSQKRKECESPLVELHELLHVFGYDHINDNGSILYPYLISCEQKLKENIINDLKKLYSEEAKAEIILSNVSATKKGLYLNFEIEIKNEGLIEAKNVVLLVYANKEEVKKFDIGILKEGSSKILNVTNLYLSKLKIEEIAFKVNSDTEEYFYDNNIIILKNE